MAAIAASWALLGAAQAGSVQVTVTDKDGKPAAEVVVLIESSSKTVAKPAVAPVVIAQQDLRFVPFLTVLPVGSSLRFVNRDDYDHHVRTTPSGPLGSTPAVVNFELRLGPGEGASAASNDDPKAPGARKRVVAAAATSVAEVKVDKPGAIGLGCHLHSSMRGQVYVSATPWFGKTDANGMLTIDGVPDGAADVQLWHTDQLQDQTTLHVQVSATPAKVAGQLNFTPRRRRG